MISGARDGIMPMRNNAPDVEIRTAAELLVNNARAMSPRGNQLPAGFDITRAHSINLITEEFLAGYMQDGRMSVVRRFFCLFVTFDLFFVSLLWLICIMINGDNIFQAFQKQILHYTIYTSLFDTVVAAICRFVVLLLFYALLYINHWLIIALSTSGSCLFLISKVFVYDWVDSKQNVFEVILIITSFVLAWGEAWFLDCRVFPQERHARRYFSTLTSSDRSPLIAPFLATEGGRNPALESVVDFYSPLDSDHDSEQEEAQDEEYHQMGLDCVRKVYELLESPDWKVEKVSGKGDTISSKQLEKLGKIYRLTGRVKYPAKALMDELFYKIESVPKWNPTLLESKIVHKINSYTDITYQATVGGGGGMVKCRDFVNLRCWRLLRNGKICDDIESDASDDDEMLNRSFEGSVSTLSDGESSSTPLPSSVESGRSKLMTSSAMLYSLEQRNETSTSAYHTLSKSLGARGFSAAPAPPPPPFDFDEPPPLYVDEEEQEKFEDAKDGGEVAEKSLTGVLPKTNTTTERVWLSAAISIEFAKVPPTSKYTRGENIVAGFAMREIAGKSDSCIFEWILCLDLKGYIPRYVLDTAYTTFMTDYMKYLRKYVSEMRQRRKRVPRK